MIISWIWRFEQFQSSSGRDMISDWRRRLTPGRRAVFDTFLDRIAKMKAWPGGICDPLRTPRRQGDAAYWELRWTAEKVEHRVFGYFGGESLFVMLLGCTHKGRVYDPVDALQTMRDRRRKILAGEGRLVRYERESIGGDPRQGLPPRINSRPN
jgi:hypothetical protein